MKTLIVGGFFDHLNGAPSQVVEKLYESYREAIKPNGSYPDNIVTLHNGGSISELQAINPNAWDILIWMPNISNEHTKILPSLKQRNPALILVSSKRMDREDFKLSDGIGRLLKSHSALGVMIQSPVLGGARSYSFRVLDPLGNQWGSTIWIEELGKILASRLRFLYGQRRMRSKQITLLKNELPHPVEISDDFIETVKRMGTRFAKFADMVNPNRLFGNASTRCGAGFPAVKDWDGMVYVSRRNVEKATLSRDDFVPALARNNVINYFGNHKPSVDTGIQLALFERIPDANFMIHGHCYVDGAPFTENVVPCGDLREVDEIARIAYMTARPQGRMVVNLRGHGCIMIGKDFKWFENLPLVGRPFPETHHA